MTLQTCCRTINLKNHYIANRENDEMSQEDLKFMKVLDNSARIIDRDYYKLRRGLHIY